MMRKGTKGEALREHLRELAETTEIGERMASVQGLMDEFDVGIASVVNNVKAARLAGVPVRSVRGPSGGYFRITDEELAAELAAEAEAAEPMTTEQERASIEARMTELRAELAALEARAAELTA